MESNKDLIETDEGIREILGDSKRIAVIGIKPESHAGQPAFYVPKYMQDAGYKIVPVPVYYPDVTEILGEPVYRNLADLPERAEMINLFRRSADVENHIDEILAAKPDSVWMQLGISNDKAADAFTRAGIKVVQNRCLLVEHRSLMR
ncbi:CoA-binding protein [soil metagenome]